MEPLVRCVGGQALHEPEGLSGTEFYARLHPPYTKKNVNVSVHYVSVLYASLGIKIPIWRLLRGGWREHVVNKE